MLTLRGLESVGAQADLGNAVFEQEHEARQLLASIVESCDDAIVSKDLNGIVMSWNAGAERLFGYSADEMIGQSITVLIPAELKDEEPRILERIARGERIHHYATVRRHKNGSLIDISLTVSPVRDAWGRVVGASKIARDITESKRVEGAFAKRIAELAVLYHFTDRLHRARTLQDVYEASLDAIQRALGCDRASILMFDSAGLMRFVAWRGLSESYRQAVEGHSPWTPGTKDPQPISIEDVAAADLSPDLRQTILAEGIGSLAFIPLVWDGEAIGKFMAYREAPHAFTSDEVELALTIARQLGYSAGRLRAEEARRRAENALRQSDERLQLALKSGGMGAWEWDIASGDVVWSPSLEEIHGLEPGTFGGRFEDFERDIHLDDRDTVRATIAKALETGEDYRVTYRSKQPGGALRWLEAFGRVLADDNGAPRKLTGVCMDVTARRQAEAQRELLLAELSHRVRNTLATVMSIAQQSFLNSSSATEARESFNSRIRALAQTHGRLAETGWSGVSCETLLHDELAPYRREDGRNVRIEGPLVTLSPKHALTLGMAMHELTTNAAKYGAFSTKDGCVEVKWTVDPDTRLLRISWQEIGGPPVEPPTRSGFGRLLLERALASDLKGNVQLEFAPTGLRCDIDVQLKSSADGLA